MKKLLLASAILGICGVAHAASNGFYLGGQLGYANTGFDTHHAFIPFGGNQFVNISPSDNPSFGTYSASVSSDGTNGRLFVGYQFNPYFAAELGYTQFAKTSVHQADIDDVEVIDNNLYGITDRMHANIRENAIDLSALAIYPIENTGVSIYGRAGLAYVEAVQHGSLDAEVTPLTGGAPIKGSISLNHKTAPIRPLYGVGLGYALTSNVSLNLDYTHIEGTKFLPSINSGTVGLAYHFA